jgi:hypothetical protein
MADGCNCNISGSDRGAHCNLNFHRGSLGFTLTASTDYSRRHEVFAFSKVEDLAAWLVEQYGPPPKPLSLAKAKPTRRTTKRRR